MGSLTSSAAPKLAVFSDLVPLRFVATGEVPRDPVGRALAPADLGCCADGEGGSSWLMEAEACEEEAGESGLRPLLLFFSFLSC